MTGRRCVSSVEHSASSISSGTHRPSSALPYAAVWDPPRERSSPGTREPNIHDLHAGGATHGRGVKRPPCPRPPTKRHAGTQDAAFLLRTTGRLPAMADAQPTQGHPASPGPPHCGGPTKRHGPRRETRGIPDAAVRTKICARRQTCLPTGPAEARQSVGASLGAGGCLKSACPSTTAASPSNAQPRLAACLAAAVIEIGDHLPESADRASASGLGTSIPLDPQRNPTISVNSLPSTVAPATAIDIRASSGKL